ncbi:MAG: DsbA family protein [Deltaproteobacteria bacterium]|nr:DsbA family protein [Deltaproteobacteria bacterium]
MMKRIMLACLAIALFVFLGCKSDGGSSVKKVVDKPAVLEFYIMSQCPYGVQVVNAIAPVVEKLGPNLDLRINYIVSKTADGNFTAMHGEDEVKGNIAQLCAMKHYPKTYMKFLLCQNKNYREVAKNWESCAKESGMNPQKIKGCLEGKEGKELLAKSYEEANKRNARGSPTMFLNGQPYSGGRKTSNFLKAICDTYQGKKPDACNNLPVAPKVDAIFFSDKRCQDCNIDRLEGRIRSDVEGLVVKKVDYMTDEGKSLYKELTTLNPDMKYLPIILFTKSLDEDKEGKSALERWLRPVGDKYYSLAIGGSFDPTAEICDNKVDDDNNGKVDCDDDGCKSKLVCRPEIPKTLDVFVMSQCPYGAKALIAMKEVLENFKNDVKFNIHYIGDVKEDGTLTAMHGQSEVDENIRQLCAIKHYNKNYKYMDYIVCRSKDYRNNDWKSCTGSNGIDDKVIQKCFDTEGKELLKRSYTEAKNAGMSASPTFLANNKYQFGGIDAETIKNNYCKYNQGQAGCENKLSQDQKVQGSCGK